MKQGVFTEVYSSICTPWNSLKKYQLSRKIFIQKIVLNLNAETKLVDICQDMIQSSSNLAANLLIQLIGIRRIGLELRKIGLAESYLRRSLLELVQQARKNK
jgi:beta-lactamase class A